MADATHEAEGAGPDAKPTRDLIKRGVKRPSKLGTLTFIGFRALDVPLQYNLVAGARWGPALLARLGIASRPLAGFALATGLAPLDNLHLPAPHLILVTMSAAAAAKQIYWLVSLSNEEFPALTAAVPVSAYNTVVNSLNALLFLASTTSVLAGRDTVDSLPLPVLVGAALFAVGMTLETVSEHQRKVFKDRPANEGKVMKTGLWRLARHINYGGYALWRAGYCMAASGWVGGLAMGLLQSYDFVSRAVPVLDRYCGGRYGAQWTQFKREVPYVILPGLY
ncbi:hypothetical protein VD0004_g3837 [Verticillium dahliae]|uniref:Steroid 5-alpha reductase C-terminal domain-containing protein n=1 Tax=Verticillium dahliae TaxID=27337 RepID=A0A444S8U7_VERDA|nr:O-methyltransferase ustE like protein [Verticillium longisporum]PNH43692.1 hypothetical protein VD0004_g3837 [Verticillium dahliae]PNH73824.1 hypothetical protein VD0001_g3753 [Verticillium dahliae]RXG49816.1 hypothetical protein VDGE_00490 [Verticillium dahliae]